MNTIESEEATNQDQKKFFIDYLNQVGFFNMGELHPLYKQSSPDQIDDIRLKVVMLAGIGKNRSLEGDFIEAKRLFEVAHNIAENNLEMIKNDNLAFIYYEHGLFYSQVGDFLNAKRYIILAKTHAKSKNLKLLINFQIEYFNVQKTGSAYASGILQYLSEFHKRKMVFMEVLVMVRLGIIYEGEKNWNKADGYFRDGLKIAEDNQIYYLEDMIHNSIGFTYANKGEYDKSLQMLNSSLETVKSYYYRTLMIENIGYVYYKKLDYKTASEKYLEAYNYANTHRVISQLPEECLYLGECYEETGELQQAILYYKLGYDHAFHQVSEGFGLNGYRRKAMKTYISFMEKLNYRKITGQPVADSFQFSLGKEWREIRNIFHYHLIMHHKSQSFSRESFLSRLEMKSSTYYTLQGKLKKQGFSIPGIKDISASIPDDKMIEPLGLYIRNTLDQLNWVEANQRFEKDIFLYLYRQYGFQKNRLGSALNLSPPIIRAKTAAVVYAYDQGLNR